MIDNALPDIATISRCVLIVVFGFAGLAKLRDIGGFRETLIEFGVAKFLAPVGAVALPVVELLTAGALAASGNLGGWLALALLVTFSGGILANLLLGRQPNCRCFGQLKSTPIGWSILLRNVVLAVSALAIVWDSYHPQPSFAASLFEQMSAGERVALLVGGVQLVMIALVVALAWQIVKQQGRILLRLDSLDHLGTGDVDPRRSVESFRIGLDQGLPAPDFELGNLLGETVTLSGMLSRGKAVLLVFSSPQCGPCQQLLPNVADWARQLAGELTVAIVSEGKLSEHKGYPAGVLVLLQKAREVADRFEAWGTPSAVLVQSDGSIGSRVAAGADQIAVLVNSIGGLSRPSEHGRSSTSLQVDDVVPEMQLPDLDGGHRAVLQEAENGTVLLFWNTQCAFCKQMEDRLTRWAATEGLGRPNVVVLANGSVPELRPLESFARVLMDSNFTAGAAFGARGTPMAVLVDAQRRVASNVVAGEEDIFVLLEQAREERQSASAA